MSYGVWRERGKGWSSIEIDGAGRDADRQWSQYADKNGKEMAKATKERARSKGLGCDRSIYGNDCEDDYYYIVWGLNQLRKRRTIYAVPTGSEHSLWLAVDNRETIETALEKLGHAGKDVIRIAWGF
jgi:hypothetical protein